MSWGCLKLKALSCHELLLRRPWSVCWSGCVAVGCNEMQCVAACCSVLQCVAVCCSVLQCVVVACSVLQRVSVCCNEIQFDSSVLQSGVVCCCKFCCRVSSFSLEREYMWRVLQCVAVSFSVLWGRFEGGCAGEWELNRGKEMRRRVGKGERNKNTWKQRERARAREQEGERTRNKQVESVWERERRRKRKRDSEQEHARLSDRQREGDRNWDSEITFPGTERKRDRERD